MNSEYTTEEILAPVTKTFVVCQPITVAFRLFTADIGRWWPLITHSVFKEQASTCIVEPHIGGRIYEVHTDDRQLEWGRVLAWEPPQRFLWSWYPGRGPETAQTVEISFQEHAEGTQITLVHSGWEHLGEAGASTRTSYEEGWDLVLGNYITLANSE